MKALDQVYYNCNLLKPLLAIGQLARAADSACMIVKNIFDDAPILGLDIDGTIDERPEFFSLLSKVWPGGVIIITCRDNCEKAKEDLAAWGVYYDKLVLVARLSDKAEVIRANNVSVYVDDQDECLQGIPSDVTVLKIRNGGNSENGKWLFSKDTGILF